MLRSITIKNFALIDSLHLEFGPALTMITGETGAGKSIIIDAFMAALGDRTSSDVIRTGQTRAVIELHFHAEAESSIEQFLITHDCERNGEELIIRRELSSKGSSRFFINDSPVQAQLLRELGALLVDFHGQHEHQSILKSDSQRQLLDAVAQNGPALAEYQRIYQQLRTVVQTFNELRAKEEELRERRDYQKQQLDDLEKINAREGEDVELERQLSLLANAESLHENATAAQQILYTSEHSTRDGLIRVQQMLRSLAEIDDHFNEQCSEVDSLVISVEELATTLRRYAESIEFQPQRIEEIRERLVLLHRLRKRFGSLQSAIEHREKLTTELQFIDNFQESAERFQADIVRLQRELGAAGKVLSERRRKYALTFDQAIIENVSELGIKNVRFSTECTVQAETSAEDFGVWARQGSQRVKANPFGIDTVRFTASMNAGEELKGLDRVLSGGEASRLMLAIKSVLADADNIPLLVFDEIDVGVSGRIARRVGSMMKKLSKTHQVIVISHQAQIASLGDHHIAVSKSESQGQTRVSARVVHGSERVHEVAALMSGDTVTEASLKSAKELMLDETL